MIKIGFKVDQYVLNRSADIRNEFVHSVCALALVFRQLFPGAKVYANRIAFSDHDGYEHSILLPEKAQLWQHKWDLSTPDQRRKLPHLQGTLEVPKSVVTAIGEYDFMRVVSANHHIWLIQKEEVVLETIPA